VDGVILCGTILPSSVIRAFAERVPLVVLGRAVAGVDVVASDNRLGARLAVEHLIGLGHRRIAHIDGGRGAGAAARRSTYAAVMREHGLAREVQVVPGNYTEQAGEAAARVLLAQHQPPTAIFAANDLCASGVLQVAYEKGISIPKDLSLVGFDDSWLARAAYISLTTIAHLPREKTASAAVDLLLDQVDGRPGGPRRLLFAPSLVIRRSTAPVQSGIGIIASSSS
jgi:DNA-binding LacI/PurR family transcriptional regulator